MELSTEKPDGTFRIAVLGDSVTFGIGLPHVELYPTVLESRYRAAGRAVEVMNLALGGYDPLQEVAALKDAGLRLDPDLVIVGYCLNDITVASANLGYIKRLERYDSWIFRSRLAQLVRVKLDRIELRRFNARARRDEVFATTYKEYLADIGDDETLRSLTASLRSAMSAEGSDVKFSGDYADETHLRRLRFAFEQLHSLRSETPERNFDVVVLAFPYMMKNEDHPETIRLIREIVRHEATRLGFRFLDLHPLFAAAGFESLQLDPEDGIHLNAQAHRLVAEALFDFLEPGSRPGELPPSPETSFAPTGSSD
jgi:lysophospholipase L1-like esterase